MRLTICVSCVQTHSDDPFVHYLIVHEPYTLDWVFIQFISILFVEVKKTINKPPFESMNETNMYKVIVIVSNRNPFGIVWFICKRKYYSGHTFS